MDELEFKNQLNGIIKDTQIVIKNLQEKREWLSIAYNKINDLENHLNEYTQQNIFSTNNIMTIIVDMFFKNELDLIAVQVDDLINENDFEPIELENLFIVLEIFSQHYSKYDYIDHAIEKLEKAIELIENMNKET